MQQITWTHLDIKEGIYHWKDVLHVKLNCKTQKKNCGIVFCIKGKKKLGTTRIPTSEAVFDFESCRFKQWRPSDELSLAIAKQSTTVCF